MRTRNERRWPEVESLEQATLNVESNSHETLIIPRDGSEVNTWIRNELILGEACLIAWQSQRMFDF